MSSTDSLFAGIGTADPDGSGRGSYFTPGQYKVQVSRAFLKEARRVGTSFILECTVLESNNPNHPPGVSRTWFVRLATEDDKTMGLANIKAMLVSVMGADYHAPGAKEVVDAAAPKLFAAVVSSGNPLSGHVLNLEAVNYVTKRGTDFTRHVWAAGPESLTPDEIIRRAGGAPVNVTPPAQPPPPPPPPGKRVPPPDARRSDDGKWWWDGSVWVEV